MLTEWAAKKKQRTELQLAEKKEASTGKCRAKK
jgi:hypothetical protein